MGDTKIQWTDKTWNPVRGCAAVSAGCENCYAQRVAHRFSGPGERYEGLTRKTAHGPKWAGHVTLVPEKLDEPLHWRKPRRVFVNSMSDLFHEDVPFSFVDRVFAVMQACPQHTFQVLTKRPERMCAYLADIRPDYVFRLGARLAESMGRCHANERSEWPLPNVHLGVSVEDQDAADDRISLLLETPAAVRFVSCEPLLGPIDLGWVAHAEPFDRDGVLDALRGKDWIDLYEPRYANVPPVTMPRFGGTTVYRQDVADRPSLDWVIVGGESGPGARPCHVEWIRNIVRQCSAANVPVFVKQLGSRPEVPNAGCEDVTGETQGVCSLILNDRAGGDPDEWPEDLRVREVAEV